MAIVRQGLSAFATVGLALTLTLVAAPRTALAQRVNQVDLATTSEQVRIGQRTGDQLGQQVATGDFNGDGRPDYAVGAPASGGPGNTRLQAGAVHVFSGRYPADRTIDLSVAGQTADLVAGLRESARDPLFRSPLCSSSIAAASSSSASFAGHRPDRFASSVRSPFAP